MLTLITVKTQCYAAICTTVNFTAMNIHTSFALL